jgi:hypothetical protein
VSSHAIVRLVANGLAGFCGINTLQKFPLLFKYFRNIATAAVQYSIVLSLLILSSTRFVKTIISSISHTTFRSKNPPKNALEKKKTLLHEKRLKDGLA